MLVHFIWPDCTCRGSDWEATPTDAFVVQCLPEETDKQIIPLLTNPLAPEDLEEIKADRATMGVSFNGMPLTDKHLGGEYFLVYKDLSVVIPIEWYYPVSHMWNGNSPMIAITHASIPDISTLRSFEIDDHSQRVVRARRLDTAMARTRLGCGPSLPDEKYTAAFYHKGSQNPEDLQVIKGVHPIIEAFIERGEGNASTVVKAIVTQKRLQYRAAKQQFVAPKSL